MYSLLTPVGMEFLNVAVGKTATQLMTYNEDGRAEHCVDGNIQDNYGYRSCCHTQLAYEAWWKVDLHELYCISHIAITNRGDCCSKIYIL